ncbi:MAG: NADH:flavin oxidoreductase, partial [Eubacteriales bacterium]|nr:NADH:flavin oxidoreductase [Eubacteriales bacterium]
VMPPMATSKCGEDGFVSEELLKYYDEKSSGGYFSLIIIEHSYVREDGKLKEGQLSVSKDRDIDGLKKLAETIHNNGTKCVMQISHSGGQRFRESKDRPLSPSGIQIPPGEIPAKEMTEDNIKEIIKAFTDAAVRVKEAGFDGVEIHSAHGYLLNQFYSPLTNKRKDAYGGDLKNRIRIHLEIVQSLKEALGEDFPILLRLGAADYMEGGTRIEDSIEAAREFRNAGVCILDVSGGLCRYDVAGLSGQGYFAPLSYAIKQAVDIPVILTGGIQEAGAAEALLAEGKADFIGVGRAVLKDSMWAKNAIQSLQLNL